MTPFARYVAALAGGAVLAFSFPEPDLFFLAWIGIAPLLIALRDATPGRGFLLGLAFGGAFFGVLLYWVSIVGWAAWAALVVLQMLFIGLFGAGWAYLRARLPGWAAVLVAGALWTVLEYARTLVPTVGFTWGELAQSQHNATWMLKLAPWGGGWAISWLIASVNALVAEAWLARRSLRPAATSLAIASGLIALPLLLPVPEVNGKEVRVAIVQGNVPRSFDGTVLDKELEIIASHARLTQRIPSGSVDLVVWPESSVGLDVDKEPAAAKAIAQSARSVGAPMIVGGNLDVDEDHYKVMAFHVSAEGEIVDRYQKTHLVPFGEYVPARGLLGWIPMLEQVPRDAIAGDEATVFDVAGGPVAPVISFEGDFGSLVRGRIDAGGRLLVVATNTSTWEESWASAQHVAFSQVRAAENGVWVVHGALSGISALISPDGSVVASSPLWEATTTTGTVRFATSPTFYARVGDWVPVVGALLVIGLGVAAVRRRSRE